MTGKRPTSISTDVYPQLSHILEAKERWEKKRVIILKAHEDTFGISLTLWFGYSSDYAHHLMALCHKAILSVEHAIS